MTRYRSDTIPVFAGPSLAGWVAAPPFDRRAPAAAGDMLRLLNGAPCTVVLVDGVFDTQCSVWHKEILLLMARGFRVIGAASMGALRAAELAPFGMIGHGAIFAAYRSERLTADDEVAVTHAPAALGAAPLSVAQVDVRAALVAAVRAGIISVDAARALREASAAIHFRDRDWPALAAIEAGCGAAGFTAWARTSAPSLKTADAHGALALALALAPQPPRATPEPPHTCFLVIAAVAAGVSDRLAVPI
jgi:hypothetical protein